MTDRAGPKSPRQKHLSLIPGPFGFWALWQEIDAPWSPPRSALAQALDAARETQKPVDGSNKET